MENCNFFGALIEFFWRDMKSPRYVPHLPVRTQFLDHNANVGIPPGILELVVQTYLACDKLLEKMP